MPFAAGLDATDHVLGHEIAHAFQIDIVKRAGRDAFSLPGYAQSSPLPVRACSISDHAAHLADAIEQAGFDLPVHLAGHSFGGGIALRIAATRPDLVDRVTLSCPIGGAGAGPPSWTGMGRSLLFDGGLRGVTNFARSLAPALARHSVQVVLSGLPSVVVEQQHASLQAAIDRALRRTESAVRRSVQRRRTRAR